MSEFIVSHCSNIHLYSQHNFPWVNILPGHKRKQRKKNISVRIPEPLIWFTYSCDSWTVHSVRISVQWQRWCSWFACGRTGCQTEGTRYRRVFKGDNSCQTFAKEDSSRKIIHVKHDITDRNEIWLTRRKCRIQSTAKLTKDTGCADMRSQVCL